VIINPGNPTGNCLNVDNMRDVVRFCHRQRLLLLADEVYQENVYLPEKQFHSFKKVLKGMGQPFAEQQELISFHSVSKGFTGECGRRGGYMELCNVLPSAREQLYKMASVALCPNLDGQVMVDLMVLPPQPGSPSHQQYVRERDAIIASLKRRALLVAASLNRLQGVTCNNAEGAMYLFPRISLPPVAVLAAKSAGKSPDTFYCLELLNSTGLVVVPGSGFGQRDSTYHFRITVLPSEDKIKSVLARLAEFHAAFISKYQSTARL